MRTVYSTAAGVICLWLLLCNPVGADPAVPPRDKYLLLDARIVEKSENVKLAVGTVKKHPANPLFGEKFFWEARFDNLYANVIYDRKENLYKCWYSPFVVDAAHTNTPHEKRTPGTYMRVLRAAKESREMGVCYATSKDGLHWNKPRMDIRQWKDGSQTNIVDIGPHGAGVMKDRRERDPQRRYKMFMKERGVAVEFSPDGLHWSEPIRCPEIDAAADTHNNAFWAPELNKYVGITRLWGGKPRQRVVGRTESSDFIRWTKAVPVLIGNPSQQTYAMPVFPFHDVYLGLPVIFNTREDRTHTELAWSPDTTHWHRIDAGTPLIPNSSERGAYDWGCVYAAAYPVILDEEIRLYYGASNGPHTDWRDGFLALATLRPDGFAGYEPADESKPGKVITRPIGCSGGTLQITADADGSVRVTVIDGDGNELATSAPITGKMTDHLVRFPEEFNLSGCKGKTIRLAFELRSAKLYAFDFSE